MKKVMPWQILAPHLKMAFTGGDYEAFHSELSRVAGVRENKGIWQIPANAVVVMKALLEKFGVAPSWGTWAQKELPEVTWEKVEAELRAKGEVRDFVLDGFMTDYQKAAVSFGWRRTGTHYWLPTGAGKTLIGLLAATAEPGPVVVVTRAAARPQYAREIERFFNVRAHILRPASQLRKKSQTLLQYLDSIEHRPFVVMGWESLPSRLAEIEAFGPKAVVFDELHVGKSSKRYDVLHLPENPTSEQKEEEQVLIREKGAFVKDTEEGRKMFVPVLNVASAGGLLARMVKKRIGTTATPVKDRVRDLWAQLDTIEPNAWGNTTVWMTRYANRKPGIYGGFDTRGTSNLAELKRRLESVAFIMDYRETHKQLPAKRRQSVYITPEDQCRELGGFAKELKEATSRGSTAVLEVKLAQAASRKRKAVLDMIEDSVYSGHKITVFTGRKRDADQLGADIRGLAAVESKKAPVWVAHGEISVDLRQGMVDAYMSDPGPCILVGTGQALGESLNIQDTDSVFMVMLPYTPGEVRQREGRFARLGQKRPVTIYYVIAEGTIDEHVAQILIDKLPAVQKIVEDEELASAGPVLAGFDPNETKDQFADAILAALDLEDEEEES